MLTRCGLPVALSTILTVAVRAPTADGVNFTLILQLAPAAKLAPQVVVRTKLVLCVPVIVILVIVSVAVPLLVNVTTFAALVVPTVCAPKASDVGDKLTT